MHVHGFPNLFIVQLAQGANLISNVPHNLTEAGMTDRRDRARTRSTTVHDEVEVTEEAEARLDGAARERRQRRRARQRRLHARLLQQRGPALRARVRSSSSVTRAARWRTSPTCSGGGALGSSSVSSSAPRTTDQRRSAGSVPIARPVPNPPLPDAPDEGQRQALPITVASVTFVSVGRLALPGAADHPTPSDEH